MVQRVVVLLEDDLDNSQATQTVRFGVDGVDHEIDLNDHHAEQLRGAFAPWVGAARTIRPARPTRRTSTSTSTSTSPHATARIDPEQSRSMRAWGREHGYTLSDLGRVPQAVQDAYHQAH